MDIFTACDQHSRNGNVFKTKAEAEAKLKLWKSKGSIIPGSNPRPFRCKARRHWHLGRDRRYRWRTAA